MKLAVLFHTDGCVFFGLCLITVHVVISFDNPVMPNRGASTTKTVPFELFTLWTIHNPAGPVTKHMEEISRWWSKLKRIPRQKSVLIRPVLRLTASLEDTEGLSNSWVYDERLFIIFYFSWGRLPPLHGVVPTYFPFILGISWLKS